MGKDCSGQTKESQRVGVAIYACAWLGLFLRVSVLVVENVSDRFV